MSEPRRILVGVDTGGTFTDFIALWPDGRCRVHKRPSTTDDPSRAVVAGLAELLGAELGTAEVTYGSTVATNAVLERKGARVAVLTTAGFEDLLAIARQTRPDIYALDPRKPPPLVPASRRFGVAERMTYTGEPLRELEDAEIARAVTAIEKTGADSVAVCLLHSYANPTHEQALAQALRARGISCSVSADLIAEYREYERLSTTVLNAYVAPVMERHLARLADGMRVSSLRVLQSSGGAISVDTAGREAVRTLLSGPAGGVVGALAAARRVGRTRILTLDMGGTSTDVSLVDDSIRRHTEWTIGELPVKVPAIDIHTVGAGGGSIARIDAGGALKVGPESAGADPGPACYGRGTQATVTDADLVLGRLPESSLLGGEMAVDRDRALAALGRLAKRLDMTAEEIADGIVRVVDAGMERAMRTISVQRGFDPREYTLVAFGGAAGMHACALAEGLGIATVLIPLHPGLLSAWGATRAPTERALVRTVRLVDADIVDLERRVAPLRRRAAREMRAEGERGEIALHCAVDARYQGQSYEIEVPLSRRYRQEFHRSHRRLYGHADKEHPVEVVNLRVTASSARSAPRARPPARDRLLGQQPHRIWWDGRWMTASRCDRQFLPVGCGIAGPLVVSEISATTVVAPGWQARVARGGDLLLERLR